MTGRTHLNFLNRLGLAFSKERFENYVNEGVQKHIADFNSGNNIVFPQNDNDLSYSAIFACFRVLAETFASVPCQEFKKLSNGDREQTDETGLLQIFKTKPNDLMSPYNWAEASMYQLNTGGNSISLRIKDGMRMGSTIGLFPVEWERIKIKTNKENNTLEYVLDNEKTLSRDEVFHVPGPSVNGLVGMSILEYAAAAIRLGSAYQSFGNNFFKNGAMPSGVFEHPKALDPVAFARFKEDLKKNYSGLTNMGTPMILEDGLKFSQLTMKLVDAEFLASRKFQVEEICRYCRVPLHLVQSLERSTNNNIEHQSLEFVMYTMLPHFKRFEQAINSQLLTPGQSKKEYYFEYNISALVRGDMKSRYEAYGIGRDKGFLSANDILRMENRPTIPNGDIYLQPMNMIEAGKEPDPTEPKEINDNTKRELDNILAGS